MKFLGIMFALAVVFVVWTFGIPLFIGYLIPESIYIWFNELVGFDPIAQDIKANGLTTGDRWYSGFLINILVTVFLVLSLLVYAAIEENKTPDDDTKEITE